MTATSYITSLDGMHIAYDCCGAGPGLVLLHGGGGRRQEWQSAGYVERLRKQFTVITLDLRGHGESAMPPDPARYTIAQQVQDILAVATGCGVDHFAIWGMSYGGKVGRYAAVQSGRVDRIVLMGTPLGLGVSGRLRQEALDFIAHWPPILRARDAGTLDLASLSPNDQELLWQLNIPSMLGWVRAMLDWPVVGPADFRCPALWLIGSEDGPAMASLREYEQDIPGSRLQIQVIEGLDHEQVFEAIERVLPILLDFMQVRTG